jgi:hypothetical protein
MIRPLTLVLLLFTAPAWADSAWLVFGHGVDEDQTVIVQGQSFFADVAPQLPFFIHPGTTYPITGALASDSWVFSLLGSLTPPSDLVDPFTTLTGPIRLTGAYGSVDLSQRIAVDLDGTFSMFVARDPLGHYGHRLVGVIATADFSDPPAVPEPRTWLLFMTGLTLLVMGRFSAYCRSRASASRQ